MGSVLSSEASSLKIGWNFRNVYASSAMEFRPQYGTLYGIRFGRDYGAKGCVGVYYTDIGLTLVGNEEVNQLSLSYSLYRFGFTSLSLSRENKLLTFVGLRSSYYSHKSEPRATWDLVPHIGVTSISRMYKPVSIRSRLALGYSLLGNTFQGRSRMTMNVEVGLGFNLYQYKRWKRGRKSD